MDKTIDDCLGDDFERTDRRQCQHRPGSDIEYHAVSRASNAATSELSLIMWCAVMRTNALDCIQLTIDVAEQYLKAFDAHTMRFANRKIATAGGPDRLPSH